MGVNKKYIISIVRIKIIFNGTIKYEMFLVIRKCSDRYFLKVVKNVLNCLKYLKLFTKSWQ